MKNKKDVADEAGWGVFEWAFPIGPKRIHGHTIKTTHEKKLQICLNMATYRRTKYIH